MDGIVDIHLRSSRAAYASLPVSVVALTAEQRRIRWREALAEPSSRVWVAEAAGTIAGFCHLRIFEEGSPPADTAEISSLYIEPSHWGEGIGGKLVERARLTAVERGCSRIFLQVYAENDRARAAYEAMGFSANAGTTLHERTGLPLMRYEMPLDPRSP